MSRSKGPAWRRRSAEGGVIPARTTRPLHLHPGYLLLAFIGGAAGTAARAGVGLAIPGGALPYATFTVNIAGAFLLAALLTALARRAPGGGHRARVLFGTGAMGGFTTYSAFAADLVTLLERDAVGAAIGYGLATVLVGGAASWAGIAVTATLHDRSLTRAGARGAGARDAGARDAGARGARGTAEGADGSVADRDREPARGSVSDPARVPLFGRDGHAPEVDCDLLPGAAEEPA